MSDSGRGMPAGPGYQHVDDATLAAWSLASLPPAEADEVSRHLASCATCRATSDELASVVGMLGAVPPEAFLDGPAPDADLLVQRTLRTLRSEDERDAVDGAGHPAATRRSRSSSSRSSWARAAAAAAAVVVLVGGGAALGRVTAPEAQVVAAPPPAPSSGAPSPGAPRPVVLDGTDADTGARLLARLEPANGWIRLAVSTTGVPRGERCEIVVRTRDGREVVAATWVVSEAGEEQGTSLQGSAWFPAESVASVRVQNDAGVVFATASA